MIEQEVGLIKRLWGNGSRLLLIANAYFLAACTMLVLVVLFAYCIDTRHDFSPLRNINPQRVQNTVLYPGDLLIVDALKCNDSGEDIGVTGTTYVVGVETRRRFVVSEGGGVRPPGCTDYHYENDLPGLPAGRYRVEGLDIARSDRNETQIEPFFSDVFEVGDGE